MWNKTELTERLNLRYPIVLGPLGGGLSTVALTATVSNAGGLGSYGAHGLTPDQIVDVTTQIREATSAPFAMNLWVSMEDDDARDVDAGRHAAALGALLPLFEQLGVNPPAMDKPIWRSFDDQFQAILEAAPPVFSFIYGVLNENDLEECRRRNIITVGTATTVEEAALLDKTGVDAIVATGLEAGGHRVSFLRPAEDSLIGNFSLIPQVVDAVKVPVIAAGGIADGRGITAALALGAAGVQIGTAFVACNESNASPHYRETLFTERASRTVLTRAFTGRLARSVPNEVTAAYDTKATKPLPYPLQRRLTAALAKGSSAVVPLWSGQSAALLKDNHAAELFERLVQETTKMTAPNTP